MTQRPEKMVPQNIEAEEEVLGALLIDRDAITRIATFLRPQHFYRDAHRTIFQVLLDLEAQDLPGDFTMVCDELERRNKLEDVGGASAIVSLINHVPTSAHVEHYAHIVERNALLRDLIEAAGKIAAVAYQNELPVEQIVQIAEAEIYKLSTVGRREASVDHRRGLADFLLDLARRSEKRRQHQLGGIPTGIPSLDYLFDGLQKGDCSVGAGRTSVGKSSFALNLARAAIGAGYTVGLFSLEMSRKQVWTRMMADETGIDAFRLKSGLISDAYMRVGEQTYQGEYDYIQSKYIELCDLPGTLWVDDTGLVSPFYINSVARRWKNEHGCDLVIIDYLGLLDPAEKHKGREDLELADSMRAAKRLARELDVHVLALAQLRRESGERGRPRLSDLKGSSAIEEHADNVLLLWMEADQEEIRRQNFGSPNPQNYEVHLSVEKQRNGQTGEITLEFSGHVLRFTEKNPPPPRDQVDG